VAGEALGKVRTATVVDAIVMASAASRGDVVYTSDYDDLAKAACVLSGRSGAFRLIRAFAIERTTRAHIVAT
jgi:hypothetical protein